MDDDGGAFVGTFTQLLADVESAEAENMVLRNLLTQGRSRVGEFHAQLMLDSIRLVNEHEALKIRLADIQKQEETLTRSINFYFDDCRRLSANNDTMIEEAKTRDAELKATDRLLTQQQSVLQGAVRAIHKTTKARRDAMMDLFESQEAKLATANKVVAQHKHMWTLDDRLAATEKEAEYLRVVATRMPQLPSKPSTLGTWIPGTPHKVECNGMPEACPRLDCVEIRRVIAEYQRRRKSSIAVGRGIAPDPLPEVRGAPRTNSRLGQLGR